jgi:RHS repeat-associated protein
MATYRFTNTTADGVSLKLTERPVYGSARLGSLRKEVELNQVGTFDPDAAIPVQQIDLNYELTDHLGNVSTVVTGRLLDGNGGGTPKQAELLSAQGYEPFGSLLPGRNYSSSSYRFGFQGQEKDTEIYGLSATYAFEYRIHDSRIGRFMSIDPLAFDYPWNSSYAFAENSTIAYIDLEGKEKAEPDLPATKKIVRVTTTIEVTVGVQVGQKISILNVGEGFYLNLFSVTLVGSEDVKEYDFSNGQSSTMTELDYPFDGDGVKAQGEATLEYGPAFASGKYSFIFNESTYWKDEHTLDAGLATPLGGATLKGGVGSDVTTDGYTILGRFEYSEKAGAVLGAKVSVKLEILEVPEIYNVVTENAKD